MTHGIEDPAAILWMVMLTVQSVPYAATVSVAMLSAVSNAERAAPPMTHDTPVPPAPEPQLPNPQLEEAA
jgi:hypothetical protein